MYDKMWTNKKAENDDSVFCMLPHFSKMAEHKFTYFITYIFYSNY